MDLWLKSAEDDTFRHEPVTADDIAAFETEQGIQLPATFVALLHEQNGGYIRLASHPTPAPTSWADDEIELDCLYGLGEDIGLLDSTYLIEEWGLPEDILLISGLNGTFIALDYRTTKSDPPVIYLEPEDELILPLAPNFETFLQQLTFI